MTALLPLVQSISNGSPLKGAAFWAWYDEGQVGPEGEGGGDGWYGIRDTSSTFALVRDSAKTIARYAPSPWDPWVGCLLTRE